MTRDGGPAGEEASSLRPKAPRPSAVTLSQPMDLRQINLMGNVHGVAAKGGTQLYDESDPGGDGPPPAARGRQLTSAAQLSAGP